MRPTWDEYFMEMAFAASKRSTCPRRQVGAVLVKDKTIIGTGYNGAPSTLPHCIDVGCELDSFGSCTRTDHAESNALSRRLVSTVDSVLYCTDRPCYSCAKLISEYRIRRVVYSRNYWRDEEMVLSHLKKNRIVLEQHAFQE